MQNSAVKTLKTLSSLLLFAGLLSSGVGLHAEDIDKLEEQLAQQKEQAIQKEKDHKAEETRKANALAQKEKERKAEETRKANAIAAQKEKDSKAEAARIARLQTKCEKDGGDWKKGKCVMPPPAKSKPTPEPVVVVESVRPAPVTFDSNLWWKDARTGCLTWRGGADIQGADIQTATWNGACGADGKAQGRGVQTVFKPDGSWSGRVTCTFQHGKCEGQMAAIYADGSRYEGQAQDHKKNGQGVAIWGDGRRHEGQYRDNLPNGYGKFYNADGSLIFEGQWANGVASVGEVNDAGDKDVKPARRMAVTPQLHDETARPY